MPAGVRRGPSHEAGSRERRRARERSSTPMGKAWPVPARRAPSPPWSSSPRVVQDRPSLASAPLVPLVPRRAPRSAPAASACCPHQRLIPYIAQSTVGSAVKFNAVYLTLAAPCLTIDGGAASDKRCSLGLARTAHDAQGHVIVGQALSGRQARRGPAGHFGVRGAVRSAAWAAAMVLAGRADACPMGCGQDRGSCGRAAATFVDRKARRCSLAGCYRRSIARIVAGRAARSRNAALMLGLLCSLSTPMAKLRRHARVRGALPLRARQRSSS